MTHPLSIAAVFTAIAVACLSAPALIVETNLAMQWIGATERAHYHLATDREHVTDTGSAAPIRGLRGRFTE
jgi:hypothetical protein